MSKKRSVKRHSVTQPLDPSYKIIALTQGQSTMVTATDFPYLDQFNWHAQWSKQTNSFYARRWEIIEGKYHIIQMAREILKCNPEEEADHKNHNTLDNRRGNLRKATSSQNGSNKELRSSNNNGLIGVRFRKKTGKWIAQIGHRYTLIHIGCFPTAEEAAHAYDEMAKKLHGEFAVLNFP